MIQPRIRFFVDHNRISMIADWIEACRLRTLPLTLACIGMGGFLAAADGGFNGLVFGLTLLTAALLQILSNLANDYGDTMNGADSDDRVGPSRAVQSGKISPGAMRNAVILLAVLSLISGISLLASTGSSREVFFVFLGFGVLSVLAAIGYTMGKRPYGYMGLGDVSVLIFFGLLGVMGTYYLQTHTISSTLALPAIACGLFATGVLNVNNIRDIESDKKAGKYSIPVRLGRTKAVYYHWGLLIIGWIAAICFVLFNYHSPAQWLFLISLPLFIINARAVKLMEHPDALDPYLKQMALSTLAFVLTFGLGQIL